MSKDRTFTALDALRGVAALSVVTLHLPILFGGKVLPGAYLAVDFFFVLSGFVLAYAYGRRLERGMTIRAWMKARIIRLYPLYILGTLIGLSVQAISILVNHQLGRAPGVAISLFCAALFLPSPVATTAVFPFLPAAWSLFFELAANWIYGWVARLGVRALATTIFVGLLLLIATDAWFGSLDVGSKLSNFVGGVGRVTFGFFAGVGLYRLWNYRTPAWSFPVWLAAPLLVAIFWFDPGAARPIYDPLVACLVMPAIVFFTAGYTGPPLLQRLGGYLGIASYPIYVLHQPLGGYLIGSLRRLGPTLIHSAPLPGIIGVTALVVGGVLLDRFYDAPIRRKLTAWLSPARPPSPDAPLQPAAADTARPL